MGTFWPGFTPRSSKARFWTRVGVVTTVSRLSPWPGRRSWFSAMAERSSSRVTLNDASLPGRPDSLFRIATEPTELQAKAFGLLGVDPDAYISVTG